MTLYGYATVVLLWLLLWWQTEGWNQKNEGNMVQAEEDADVSTHDGAQGRAGETKQKLKHDLSTTLCRCFNVVWIKRMHCGEDAHHRITRERMEMNETYRLRRIVVTGVLIIIVLALGCGLLSKATDK